MKRKLKRLITCLIAVSISIMAFGDVYGEGRTAKMSISVRVLPKVDYQILQSSSSLEITSDDLASGYKEISDAAVVSVTSNSSDGYFLSVCGQKIDAFASIIVTVDNDSFELPSYGCTEVYAPSTGMISEVKRLSYRVNISPQTETGLYPLPVAVTAYPL